MLAVVRLCICPYASCSSLSSDSLSISHHVAIQVVTFKLSLQTVMHRFHVSLEGLHFLLDLSLNDLVYFFIVYFCNIWFQVGKEIVDMALDHSELVRFHLILSLNGGLLGLLHDRLALGQYADC